MYVYIYIYIHMYTYIYIFTYTARTRDSSRSNLTCLRMLVTYVTTLRRAKMMIATAIKVVIPARTGMVLVLAFVAAAVMVRQKVMTIVAIVIGTAYIRETQGRQQCPGSLFGFVPFRRVLASFCSEGP